MAESHYRYFIELLPSLGGGARWLQSKARRDEARHFIALLQEWVSERGMTAEISRLEITAMGQVHIVCSSRLIGEIRDQDMLPIGAIRAAQERSGGLGRLAHQLAEGMSG